MPTGRLATRIWSPAPLPRTRISTRSGSDILNSLEWLFSCERRYECKHTNGKGQPLSRAPMPDAPGGVTVWRWRTGGTRRGPGRWTDEPAIELVDEPRMAAVDVGLI